MLLDPGISRTPEGLRPGAELGRVSIPSNRPHSRVCHEACHGDDECGIGLAVWVASMTLVIVIVAVLSHVTWGGTVSGLQQRLRGYIILPGDI